MDLFFVFVLFASCWIIYLVVSYARKIFTISPANKVILISGCDSGFGKDTSISLAKLGCKVLAGCYTEAGLEALNKVENVVPIPLDITREDSIKDAYEIVKKHCPNGLWALINNAGMTHGFSLEFTTMEIYRTVMNVNFFGHVAMTKQFLPLIKKSKGRIINMASIAGRTSHAYMSAYVASKHAIEGWNECLREDLHRWGIHVIIVEPGFMKTPLVTQQAERSIEECMRQTPKEIVEAYGGENFTDYHKKTFARVAHLTDDPKLVVDTYVNACLSQIPKSRYVVGKGTTFLLFLSFWPTWLRDPFMSCVNRFGLGPPPPVKNFS